MNLNDALSKYKECTIKLIQFLEKEHYDYIDNAMDDRQKIIDEIGLLNYSDEEFKKIAMELKLVENEKKLTEIMLEKKDKAKEELVNFKKSNNVNKSYNKMLNAGSVFVNKKI
jgi:nucleoside-triphosphatase THEP1